MAKKVDPTLVEILTRYGERAEDALWDCHGTWVAYHKAIERIAAKADIVFDMPTIVEANSAAKTAVVVVKGKMGDNEDYREEWSFGEASPANNKNAYPYAMAEKRAKDRVVLKLIGLHGLVYSEEESDDFKGEVPQPAPAKSAASLKREGSWEEVQKQLDADLLDCASTAALSKLRADYREKARDLRWPAAWLTALRDKFDSAEADIMRIQTAAANHPLNA